MRMSFLIRCLGRVGPKRRMWIAPGDAHFDEPERVAEFDCAET